VRRWEAIRAGSAICRRNERSVRNKEVSMSNAPRIALVTGATGGIGRSTAFALARAGWRVFATGRRAEAMEALRAEVGALPIEVLALDVTDGASVRAAHDAIREATGGHGVDLLVNNAGYGQIGPVVGVPIEHVRRQYDTNVFGLLEVTRIFTREMIARGSGRVVNVSSIGGRLTFPFMGIYSSTKYAVESLSDALRMELGPLGVQVVVIEPGYIRTQFADTSHGTLGVALRGTPWAGLADRYAALLARFDATGSPPETVANAIVAAADARRPRARYIAPWWAGSSLSIGWIPTLLADALIRVALGLPRHPAPVPATA
jgi:NAD(P)-dependent dehydrogenase (short-subunit alcohol dehydrogenase family)